MSPSKPSISLSVWYSQHGVWRLVTQADITYSEYKLRVESLDRDTQIRYQSLLQDTMDGLKSKYDLETVRDQVQSLLKPKDARRVQYSRIYNSQTKGQLENVKDYDKLKKYLDDNYCAWFNVDLIESIRRVLLIRKPQDSILSAYKEHVTKYLARCCLKNSAGNEIVCKIPTDFRKVEEKHMLLFVTKLLKYFRIPAYEVVINTNGELILKVPPEAQQMTDCLGCPASQSPAQATCEEQVI